MTAVATDSPNTLTVAPRPMVCGGLPARVSALHRFMAAAVGAGCAAVLGLGAWLTPAAEGHGTHTQLGLTPCMWALSLGKPCPTCGMTTAVSHAAHGNLLAALRTQPFGLLVAVGVAVGFWAALHIALTGAPTARVYGRLLRPRVLWVLAGAAGLSWAYKIAVWHPGG